MVFRVAAEGAHSADERDTQGPLARVDASGARGRDGADGVRGLDGTSGGGHGGRGGDAGPAERGGDAGTIHVRLRAGGERPLQATLEGAIKRAEGRSQSVYITVDFEKAGTIDLIANGGAGGNGGRGGAGGNGGKGARGADATQFSSGSNGGPGGDGGQGGRGSSGAPGGHGGSIVVRVHERDTHLLLLLTRQTLGGPGGRPGLNGPGGRGGDGGDGGSSYSWTETEHYTDAQGQSQTRTTFHSNPGGSNGPRGRDGLAGQAALSAGAQGRPGSFAIEVEDDRGAVRRYAERYELAVVGFQHDNENRDGVYEPHEKVIVSRIAVKNIGAMPTPAHHDVVIGVVEKGWVDADERQLLTLPRALEPGQTHVFERESLSFVLHGHRPTQPGAPLAESETIHLFAAIPAANRRFGAFESTLDKKTGQIVVRFPVEVSPMRALYSLAPGEATKLRFTLSNVALSALGRSSPSARELAARMRLAGGELYDGEVIVVDERGHRARLDEGWREVVSHIDPQRERAFELIVAIAPDARPYTSARLELSAELGWLDDPKNARAVHLRDLTIRVGQRFDRRASDVLIITNNRTDRDELSAWQRLCEELGLSHALWDASLEDSLAVLQEDAPFSLVIVLDYEMDTPSGRTRVSELLPNARAHALSKRTSALYVSDAQPVRDQLIPLGASDRRETVTRWYFWPSSAPRREHLEDRARALNEALVAARPDERHLIVERFDPSIEKKLLWLRKMKLGTLELRRAFDGASPSVAAIHVGALSAQSTIFVGQYSTLASVLAALPFERKLRLLRESPLPFGARVDAVDGGVADAIVAAIVDDLLYELERAAEPGWKRGVSSRALFGRMPLLRALIDARREGALSLESDEGRRMIELCAWLELLGRGAARWWEWLPFAWGLRRGPALRARLLRARRALIERGAESAEMARSMDRAITERRRAIERRWSELERDERPPRSGLARLRRLLDARFGAQARTDARALFAPYERILDGVEFDRLARDEEARCALAREVEVEAKGARDELLVPDGFASVSARAEALRREALRAMAEEITPTRETGALLGRE